MKLFEENEENIYFNVENDEVDIREFLEKQKISSKLFKKLYKNKHIYVNGKFRRKGLEIKKGEKVLIHMEKEKDTTIPENLNIDIVYEDPDVLIVNKKPSMVVHLTRAHQNNTLSNGVAYYFKENNINRKIRFVNRLDKDTTGLLIIAKNPYAHHQLALQFQSNQVKRKYLAMVDGVIKENKAYMDYPIIKETERSIKRIVRKDGQQALSKYIVKERYAKNTLVEVEIFTGRPHQIRVHLSHIGYPIVGDKLYGIKSNDIDRQALHSYYLKIKQPRTKENIEITMGLPKDMTEIKKSLK